MSPLAEWQTLLAVQAGAAATLTGLVFVAVSINIGKIIAVPGLPSRALESLLQFLQVFFICSATLIPRQSAIALAIEILVIAILSWTMQLLGHLRYAKSRGDHPKWWLVARVTQTQLATIPFVVAAICLSLDLPGALYWLALGFAFSFASGVIHAWILLIEILR